MQRLLWYFDMSKEKYLCPCRKVTKKDIKDAVKDGASSFKEVRKVIKVADGCGHCACKVKKYAKKQIKKQSS